MNLDTRYLVGVIIALFAIISALFVNWNFALTGTVIFIISSFVIYLILHQIDRFMLKRARRKYTYEKDESRRSDNFPRQGIRESPRGELKSSDEPYLPEPATSKLTFAERDRKFGISDRESKKGNKPNRYTPI